jgi:plasmid stability protein
MKSIHVRAVHPDTLAALKRLARSHHRSLQGELLTILDRAARLAPPVNDEEESPWITVETGRSTTWPRSELYDDQDR